MLRFGRVDPERVRSGVRWFATELVVVTAGILLALAAQAWWEERENRARERDYLERLLDDTRRNEEEIARLIEADSGRRALSVAMLRILRDGSPMPSQDSLVSLTSMSSASGGVLTTTAVDALTSSGDLRLLTDPAVRDSTLRVFNLVRDVRLRVEHNNERVVGSISRRTAAMLRHRGPVLLGHPSERARAVDTEWMFRVDFEALRRDPDGLAPFQDHVYARNNNLQAMRSLRARLPAYRALLERALAAR